MAVGGWWKVSIRPALPTLEHARSLFDYGKWSMISAIGGHVYSWMDVVILTAFVSTGIAGSRAGIGAYENACRVSLIV
ncbi:MAG: flippase, partial [Halobacteriaceae archaeon]